MDFLPVMCPTSIPDTLSAPWYLANVDGPQCHYLVEKF
jgi:hypothetical protein